MAHYSRLSKIVIDVPEADHDRELAFWAGATGQQLIQFDRHPDYHGAELPGHDLGLLVQRLSDGPGRVHLDIHTDDPAAELARLEKLGAELVAQVHAWWIIAIPPGCPSALFQNPPARSTAATPSAGTDSSRGLERAARCQRPGPIGTGDRRGPAPGPADARALDCALMPSRAEIVSFDDSPPPPGADPWVVAGAGPGTGIELTDPDPAWPRQYDRLAGRIRQALGWRALQLEHVGSTAVPGLAAKPIIDIDLTVADPGRERDYVPALKAAGFRLTVREPWWHGHRLLQADDPRCNLHVFGFDSPELIKHRIFRDWLRGNPGDRDRYAAAKRRAASEANAAGEHVMQYNARKQQVIREIYRRAFAAAGLLEP